MSAKFALRPILVLCVIMLLSTLVVGSAVSAKESPLSPAIMAAPPEQSIQGGGPVPGGPGFISVSTFSFKPHNSLMNLSYGNAVMYNAGGSGGIYFAPVNLPHGASLTKVLFFYHDTVTEDMNFYMERVNMFDGSTQVVASATSTGIAGNGYVESTIFERIINNQLYSYILRVDIPGGVGGGLSLFTIRIDYSYPVYLPTVQK